MKRTPGLFPFFPWGLGSWSCWLLLALALGCTSQRKASQAIPQDFFLSIERTPCYGRCPIYTLEVDARGHVRYEGERFVEKTGTYKGRLKKDQLTALVERVKSVELDAMKDTYQEVVSNDLPSLIISCQMNGNEKRVVDHSGGPAELEALEEYAKNLLNEIRLKTVKQPVEP